jgi:NAD(P)-dependent dehydrogenase (short-subunit alcohol dehydrogenase family)
MSAAPWTADQIADQTGRRVVITGATSGLGKEAARVLAEKNATVIIAARNTQKAEATAAEIRANHPNADISCRALDLSSLKSVAGFAESLSADVDRLDVLINNAGVMMCPYSKTEDGFEIQMGTNHLGHFALTGHLMPLLKKTAGARIVVLSSIAHRAGNFDLADLNWETRKYKTGKAYGDSKIANLYFAYELTKRLAGDDNAPVVTAAHPGWTATDLQRHSGPAAFLNPFLAQGVAMGTLPTLRAGFDQGAAPGDYFGPNKFFQMRGYPIKVTSNARSHDTQTADALWRKSEELTGVTF